MGPWAAPSNSVTFARSVSYGDANAENMAFFGDNLDALGSLRPRFEGAVRCAYLDPPYNTGRQFAEYTDRLSPSDWVSMMAPRLEAIRPLIADDGTVFLQIDDTELASLQLLADAIFGRDNRVSTITLVRSAGTGHKAINRGPVNVTDFILVYAKCKSQWRPNALTCPRSRYDAAYTLFVPNRDASPEQWRFLRLEAHVATTLGHKTARAAKLALGISAFEAHKQAFALAHAGQVVRFAQPRYEAVGREFQRFIDRSRGEPEGVLVLKRAGNKDVLLRGGDRILTLADKVEQHNGAPTLVEPLTNVWNDIPFQGIAREGGVTFVRNKKPERLIERILRMATDEGDWVIDPFVGSGTTAAVAHKMGRRWIGIERGDEQFFEMCVPRLQRVVEGRDLTGISRAVKWGGGGGFSVMGST